MNDRDDWDDKAREDLRHTLRHQVIGEVRLSKLDPSEILATCREAYIDDECPHAERETFARFAEHCLQEALARHALDQSAWPSETDCDRLDRVEAALRDDGILFWQASPCCDTCSGAELPDRIDAVEARHPGFSARVRGYAFFIDQGMADALGDDTSLRLYLAYGALASEEAPTSAGHHESEALAIAREVCDSLHAQGFEPDWDGSHRRKIGVRVDWRRRTPLT